MSTAFLFNNKMMKYGTHVMGISSSPTPPGPVLPANTVRVRTSDGLPPVKGKKTSYETATLVEGTSDVYDVYKSGNSFYYLLGGSNNITEVLGVNTEGIISMGSMFYKCSALISVPLFDTSSVTNMSYMFERCSSLTTVPLFNTASAIDMDYMFSECTSLTSIPLFNTSNATNINYMFYRCLNVESGALALYNQANTQATPPSEHMNTFWYCGHDTTTGAAELAQIPSSWGGTGA